MPLIKGTTSIGSVYKGTTKIDSIYKGTTLVYSSGTWEQWYQEFIYNALIPTTINSKQVKNKARVDTIYGNSVVENQLQFGFGETPSSYIKVDGTNSYATPDYSSPYTVKFTLKQNAVDQLNNGGDVGIYNYSTTYTEPIIGHSYLLVSRIKSPKPYTAIMRNFGIAWGGGVGNGSSTTSYSKRMIANEETLFYRIVTATSTTNSHGVSVGIVKNADVTPEIGDVFEVSKVMIIDLTQMFPFDTPTTLDNTRIQAILNGGYIPYNAGEIKSVNIGEISSEPYNLFDGQWEIGNLSGGTLTTNCHSKNYIKVVGGKSYILENGTNLSMISGNTGWYLWEYDKDFNVINKTNRYGNLITQNYRQTYSLTNQTCYIKFYLYASGTNFANNFPKEFSFHRTGTRTGYAPYQAPQTISFKYQGSGVGTAHNTMEITSSAYVFTKNMSRYTFSGSDTWSATSGNRYYYGGLINLIYKPATSTIAQLLTTASLSVVSRNDADYLDKVMFVFDNGNIGIKDTTNITSTATAQSYMTGKTIEYQLATPQVISIPKKHLACVDLGSLNWYMVSSGRFYAEGFNSPSTLRNCYVEDYLTDFSTNGIYEQSNKTVQMRGDLKIIDSNYTTLQSFKNAMSGVYFFYETENEIPDIATQIGIQAGGTITSDSVVLSNIEFGVKCK